MQMPMLALLDHLIDDTVESTLDGPSVPAHVRCGPGGLAIDVHVDGDDEVYAVLIPWPDLELLMDATDAAVPVPASLGPVPNQGKELLN